MATDPIDANDWLLGSGVPSATFETIGSSCSGVISTPPTMTQQRDFVSGEPKFFKNGDPMMQMVVTLQTAQRDKDIEDDDGTRRLYVKNRMKQALQEACRKAGAKLEPGGILTVTFTSEEAPETKGLNPTKIYSATYIPADQAGVDAFLAQPAAAAAPAAAPAAPAGVDPAAMAAALASLSPEQRAALGLFAAAEPPF